VCIDAHFSSVRVKLARQAFCPVDRRMSSSSASRAQHVAREDEYWLAHAVQV
jgi:hypothetical protein